MKDLEIYLNQIQDEKIKKGERVYEWNFINNALNSLLKEFSYEVHGFTVTYDYKNHTYTVKGTGTGTKLVQISFVPGYLDPNDKWSTFYFKDIKCEPISYLITDIDSLIEYGNGRIDKAMSTLDKKKDVFKNELTKHNLSIKDFIELYSLYNRQEAKVRNSLFRDAKN